MISEENQRREFRAGAFWRAVIKEEGVADFGEVRADGEACRGG